MAIPSHNKEVLVDDNVINLPIREEDIILVRIPVPSPDLVTIVVCRDGKFAYTNIVRELLEDEGTAFNAIAEAMERCDEYMDDLGEHP